MKIIKAIAATCLLLAVGAVLADNEARPKDGPKGTWANLGRVTASHSADHDRITVTGKNDEFRKLKFKVSDAPLNMNRVVVTYDSGAPETLNVRENIPKGGESRDIDLHGGKRSIRTIEFWYDTKGMLNGKADVTVYALR
jgi:hypothetical protein